MNSFFISILGLLSLFISLWAIIDLFRNLEAPATQKLICVLMILLSSFPGAILYFQLKQIFRRRKEITIK